MKAKGSTTRRAFIGSALLAALGGLAGSADAAQIPYTQAKFDAALRAGTPTIVYVRASWCPTCHAQQPIVDRLSADPRYRSVTILLTDFDTEKALKQRLRVNQQSTFVVFNHGHEVTRSTGQTAEPAIRDMFDKAL